MEDIQQHCRTEFQSCEASETCMGTLQQALANEDYQVTGNEGEEFMTVMMCIAMEDIQQHCRTEFQSCEASETCMGTLRQALANEDYQVTGNEGEEFMTVMMCIASTEDCTATVCAENQHVSSNACMDCIPGSANAAGDDPCGVDTACDVTLCAEDEYVSSNECTACEAGKTNAAGDDPTGADTVCTDIVCASSESTTGYIIVAETELIAESFDVSVSCDEGYEGAAIAVPCTSNGDEYALAGCEFVCHEDSECTFTCDTETNRCEMPNSCWADYPDYSLGPRQDSLDWRTWYDGEEATCATLDATICELSECVVDAEALAVDAICLGPIGSCYATCRTPDEDTSVDCEAAFPTRVQQIIGGCIPSDDTTECTLVAPTAASPGSCTEAIGSTGACTYVNASGIPTLSACPTGCTYENHSPTPFEHCVAWSEEYRRNCPNKCRRDFASKELAVGSVPGARRRAMSQRWHALSVSRYQQVVRGR